MLDTKDVAEMFKRCNLAVYAEARRIYYREVNLNPCKKYPKQVLQRIEWWFWDWFAYDCAVSGIGLTGNESEDLRIELQYGPGAGISPFLALAEFMYDKDERIGTREIRDFRELDDTNFASMFWIRDASAVKGRLTVEDIIHGGVYEVADVHAASQYDGAHGGMIVNRSFRETRYKPDFAGLVRFFYGRAKDTGLDWEDVEAARQAGTLGALIKKASNR